MIKLTIVIFLSDKNTIFSQMSIEKNKIIISDEFDLSEEFSEISNTSFKRFVWILPKEPFFFFVYRCSFFKYITDLSAREKKFWLTEIFWLIAWTLGWFSKFLTAISTGSRKFSVSLKQYTSGLTLRDITISLTKS